MNVRFDMITVFVARPDESRAGWEFLQLHRTAGDYLGETWQTVRGGVEPEEPYVLAALRELREETGLAPRELYRLGVAESFYTDTDDTLWHSVAFCVIVDRSQVIRLNDEHDAFRWIPYDQLDSHLMWASERALLPDLRRDILENGLAKPHLRVKL